MIKLFTVFDILIWLILFYVWLLINYFIFLFRVLSCWFSFYCFDLICWSFEDKFCFVGIYCFDFNWFIWDFSSLVFVEKLFWIWFNFYDSFDLDLRFVIRVFSLIYFVVICLVDFYICFFRFIYCCRFSID